MISGSSGDLKIKLCPYSPSLNLWNLWGPMLECDLFFEEVSKSCNKETYKRKPEVHHIKIEECI